MQSVNIAELKNNLSHYLRQVREGNEITVRDRNRVIARIVPAAPHSDYDENLLELAAQGKVRLPEAPLDEATVTETLKSKLPRLKSAGKAAKEVLERIMEEERGYPQTVSLLALIVERVAVNAAGNSVVRVCKLFFQIWRTRLRKIRPISPADLEVFAKVDWDTYPLNSVLEISNRFRRENVRHRSRVVFVFGAGASRDAGLPLYRDLIDPAFPGQIRLT